MEKQFIQIQLALFLKSDFTGQFEEVSLAVKREFSNVTVQLIGLPNNAPSEIPRLIANSDFVNINVSVSRIDFFSKGRTFVMDDFEKIWNIVNSWSSEIGRIGVVVTMFKEGADGELKDIFDQTKISEVDPQDITVRFNEQTQVNGINVNNSQMYVTGVVKDEHGADKKGVIITRDINALSTDLRKNVFNKDSLKDFVSKAVSLTDKSLI